MKIYTIMEIAYTNTDGRGCCKDITYLDGMANSFIDRKMAEKEILLWIWNEIHYEGEGIDIEETYDKILKNKRASMNREEWELELTGKVYKWSLTEEEVNNEQH